jgi:hypothetical protein
MQFTTANLGAVDVAADAKQLGASVVLTSKCTEPAASSPQDSRCYCYCLYICDSCWAAEDANVCWEGRLLEVKSSSSYSCRLCMYVYESVCVGDKDDAILT